MRTLFLDLASHSSVGAAGILACVTDEKVVASKSVDHRIGDEEVVPLFEKLLEEARWEQKDIGRIACVIGPGGFTSLRVAVAFANALSFSLDVPVAGVHLSDLWGVRLCHGERRRTMTHMSSFDSAQDDTLWLHSTKKTQLFVRGFGNFEKQFPDASCKELGFFLEELPPFLSRGEKERGKESARAPDSLSTCPVTPLKAHGSRPCFVFVGELIPEHETLISSAGGMKAETKELADILPGFVSALTYEKKTLEPWYGRSW